jgi:hypothetical protein
MNIKETTRCTGEGDVCINCDNNKGEPCQRNFCTECLTELVDDGKWGRQCDKHFLGIENDATLAELIHMANNHNCFERSGKKLDKAVAGVIVRDADDGYYCVDKVYDADVYSALEFMESCPLDNAVAIFLDTSGMATPIENGKKKKKKAKQVRLTIVVNDDGLISLTKMNKETIVSEVKITLDSGIMAMAMGYAWQQMNEVK